MDDECQVMKGCFERRQDAGGGAQACAKHALETACFRLRNHNKTDYLACSNTYVFQLNHRVM
jgi:hypothetical protein